MTPDRPVLGERPLRRPGLFFLTALLSLLLPGLGHFVAGERRRALGFFVIVAAAFGMGIALDGSLPGPAAGHPLAPIATATTAATGLPFLAARLLGLGRGNPGSATFDVGNGYLLTAGTMSLLLVVDLLARGSRLPR